MFETIQNILGTTGSIIFWFIIILIPLVIIHEYGHFLVARLFKVRVVEFGVGMPPRAFYRIKKGIIWSINWLPLGGFAKIYGDHDAIDEANESTKKNLPRKQVLGQYQFDRVVELVGGRELEVFLNKNHLEYDQKWQDFEKACKKSSYDVNKMDETNARLFAQLNTLIEWEMDSEMTSKHTFYSKSYVQKALILLGGIVFNLLTAVVLFSLLAGFSTLSRNYTLDKGSITSFTQDFQENVTNVETYIGVADDSASAKAGLETGDKIVQFGNKKPIEFESLDSFKQFIQDNKDGFEVAYQDKSDNNTAKTAMVVPELKDGVYKMGASYVVHYEYESRGFWNAIGLGRDQTGYIWSETWNGLVKVVKALFPNQDKSVLQDMAGPVRIGSYGSVIYADSGVAGILTAMAMISVGLALFNLLPIPALDGGRLLLLTINKVTGRRNKKVEGMIIGATFLLLMGLQILITYNDISNIIK